MGSIREKLCWAAAPRGGWEGAALAPAVTRGRARAPGPRAEGGELGIFEGLTGGAQPGMSGRGGTGAPGWGTQRRLLGM